MSEVKRQPVLDDGTETVTFDDEHTLSDFIRYLLTQTDRDELAYLIETVEA